MGSLLGNSSISCLISNLGMTITTSDLLVMCLLYLSCNSLIAQGISNTDSLEMVTNKLPNLMLFDHY